MFGRLGIAEILMILFLLIRFAVIAAVVYLLAKALLKYIKEGSGSQTFKKTLGEVIKKHREDKGFTQEMLAERLGVSRQAVSKWEKGTTEPSTSNLFALAKVFDMPIEDFMREIEIWLISKCKTVRKIPIYLIDKNSLPILGGCAILAN